MGRTTGRDSRRGAPAWGRYADLDLNHEVTRPSEVRSVLDGPPVPVIDPDLDLPNAARMYDYLLGGSHNFRADRIAVEKLLAAVPDAADTARANRGFVTRAIRFLLDRGVRQFIDIGAGIPTYSSVHELARTAGVEIRCAYVDVDPVVVTYSRSLLSAEPGVVVHQADLREADRILTHPRITAALDLTQPVAVLLGAVLHFVPDTVDPAGIMARLREAVVPGSYFVISHLTGDGRPEAAAAFAEAYLRTHTPMVPRGRDQILRLCAGLELLSPGLVTAPSWRPGRPVGVHGALVPPVRTGPGFADLCRPGALDLPMLAAVARRAQDRPALVPYGGAAARSGYGRNGGAWSAGAWGTRVEASRAANGAAALPNGGHASAGSVEPGRARVTVR